MNNANKKPVITEADVKNHNLQFFTKDRNNPINFTTANVHLDAENNNVHSPKSSSKCKIIMNRSNHKLMNNVKKALTNKTFSKSEYAVENITKIEVTDHSLDLENIQTLEDIHKGYSEVLATPLSEESIKSSVAIEETHVEDIDVDNETLQRKSNRDKKSIDQLSLNGNFVKKKKRKYVDRRKPPKKIEGLEKNEKLFIRLVKFDISAKLSGVIDNMDVSFTNNESHNLDKVEELQKNPIPLIKPELLPILEKPTKKVSKIEIQKQNLFNINKTESLKMEQLLLQKFKRAKEKAATENNPKNTSENSADDVEPYVYEKTKKSVYETYERTEDENGQMMLKCLLCPFSGERFKQMSLHYKFKHRDTPIEEMHFCDLKGCQFKTVHKGMFKWHMRRHMLAKDKLISDLYPCDQCHKVFEQRKGFLIHLKHMHKEPTPPPKKSDFPCATCKFRTTTEHNLQAHIYRSHVPDGMKPSFTCNICGYETYYKDSLKKHLTRIHLKDK